MSKSLGNAIAIFDPPEVVEKKIKGSFTDPQKLRRGDPGRPEICNVFTMHRELSDPAQVSDIETNCRSGALACGDCKKMLAAAMEAEVGPSQRGLALRSDSARADHLEGGRGLGAKRRKRP
jgi:tryptophanyl-tRNA synthetase